MRSTSMNSNRSTSSFNKSAAFSLAMTYDRSIKRIRCTMSHMHEVLQTAKDEMYLGSHRILNSETNIFTVLPKFYGCVQRSGLAQ